MVSFVQINYKRSYEECKGNLEEQTERFQKRVILLTNEHNELVHMRECCKADYERLSTEYNTLQGNFDKLEADSEEKFNIMKTNLDTEIQDMDKLLWLKGQISKHTRENCQSLAHPKT